MTRLSQLLHLDDGEFPALRAQIETKPMPRVGIPATTRRPLRIDEPARAYAALAGLHAEAPVQNLRVVNGIGMRRPAAPSPTDAPQPLPSRDLIEYVTAVSTAMHDDYARHLDTMAVLDEISAVLTEHPELLAPPSHPGPRLWLRRIVAELAPFAPKAGC